MLTLANCVAILSQLDRHNSATFYLPEDGELMSWAEEVLNGLKVDFRTETHDSGAVRQIIISRG